MTRFVPSLVLAAFLSTLPAVSAPAAEAVPITGAGHPDLASFDELMVSFLREHEIPGAALAVARGGKLVYARGFGYADRERREPVQPEALFRIASLSKPITAAAIFTLIEQGKLRLDDRALPLLGVTPHLAPGASVDPRLETITIRQLLQHTAGFDRDKSFDPMFRSLSIAEALGVPCPAEPLHIIRYMAGRPLDFNPGERGAYSNFGYCVLGRVIEKVSGQPYADYVRARVLAPLGITDMRIGRTLPEGRAPGEVRYYPSETKPRPACVGQIGEPAPMPYGVWYLEAMDAHGGWIASAPGLVRFASHLQPPGNPALLSVRTAAEMFRQRVFTTTAPASGPTSRPAVEYACGWNVRRVGRRFNAWHTGLLSGTSSILVRRQDGLTWAVLFNGDADAAGQRPASVIDPLVHRAADAVKRWPEIDLFPVSAGKTYQ